MGGITQTTDPDFLAMNLHVQTVGELQNVKQEIVLSSVDIGI